MPLKIKPIYPLILSAMLFTTLWLPRASWGAKVYVIDTKDIPLRSGPSQHGRIVATIPSGAALELLKGNEYARVRYTDPNGATKEGWVSAFTLGARPPESVLTKELQADNNALKEQVIMLEREKGELSQKEKELSDKVTRLEQAYEVLKSGSANYVKLKEEYETARSSLGSAQENIQSLQQENENLKLTQYIQWFGSGALVLLLGWLLGWLTGRNRRKQRSRYSF